jgi:hypothetical protein
MRSLSSVPRSRQAPAILVFRARRANHGTDPPLAASPGHQQRLAVDRIGLGRRCRRSTAIEAASTTWLSIPLASRKR